MLNDSEEDEPIDEILPHKKGTCANALHEITLILIQTVIFLVLWH